MMMFGPLLQQTAANPEVQVETLTGFDILPSRSLDPWNIQKPSLDRDLDRFPGSATGSDVFQVSIKFAHVYCTCTGHSTGGRDIFHRYSTMPWRSTTHTP